MAHRQDGARHAVEQSIPRRPRHPHRLPPTLLDPIVNLLPNGPRRSRPHLPHRYKGIDYTVSYQWTLWRIQAHDIHHGGMIALMLAMQDIPAFELRALGGHITAHPSPNHHPPQTNPATPPLFRNALYLDPFQTSLHHSLFRVLRAARSPRAARLTSN